MKHFRLPYRSVAGNISSSICGALAVALAASLQAGDQPQWGEAWTRNMSSSEKNLPATFDPQTGQNVKWSAAIGTETHSTPIVAGGRVYIGTNNNEPRDPKHKGDRGVLMCFEEKTGKFLWQLVVPKREEDPYFDWPKTGISSPATVEGDRVYIVSNRGEVLCLDARGMANGNDGPFKEESAHMTPPEGSGAPPKPVVGAEIKPEPLNPPPPSKRLQPDLLDADIIWTFDMVAEAGIWPHDGAHSSILVHGDYLYLNTASGVDNTHKRIRTPDAPALIVLNKKTGKYVARERENIAPYVFHNTWAAPSLGVVNGKPLIFLAAGNGTVYAFETLPPGLAGGEPRSLKKVWQFAFDPSAPRENVHKFNSNRAEGPSNFYGMPVFQDGRIYVAGGGDIFWGKNSAWLKCIDATKTGDISTNGLIWSYPLEKHVLSTPALYNGMCFIADSGRKMHCVDQKNGSPIWTDDIKGEVWASPMVADGKVYLGTRSGDFYIWEASRDKKLLHHQAFNIPISGTATPANGVVFVATMSRLYALAIQ